MLNFSSRIKEKKLCNPLEAMDYFVSDSYFQQNSQKLIADLESKINESQSVANMANNTMIDMQSSLELLSYLKNLTDQKLGDYRMAESLCKISKRKLIVDADFLSKNLDIPFLANYVNMSKKKYIKIFFFVFFF